MEPERSGKIAASGCAGARTSAGNGSTVLGGLLASFKIPAMAVAGIALLVLSCGDGAVEPPPPPAPVATTITVNPGSATLSALGETARLTAEVRDQNGQAMAGAAVAWASSDASVATVDASGVVTAAANGSATITATAGSVSGTAAVTVAQVVTAVAVSPAADTLVAFGDTVRLVAEAADANGHAMATVTEFEWSSSDTLVARVDDSGLVESVGKGETAVMATASEVTGETELTVVSPLPTTVAVSPDIVRFTAFGQTEQLAVEVRDQAGRVMAEATVSWSSGDTLVAVVDSAGLVTAVGAGTTSVAAVARDVSDAVAVTVTQSAGSVVVSPAESTIGVGDALRLSAEAFDENGNRVNGAVFSWSSSNAGVAGVDDTGLVEGVAEGTARIRATTGDAWGVAEVTVESPDRAALVALYEATNGPNWVDDTNWLTDAPLGEWYGVHTDHFGRVVRLDLAGRRDAAARRTVSHGLIGSLPPELGNLIGLRTLDLGDNDLFGAIPPDLGNLTELRRLDLGDNNLTGAFPPALLNLVRLESLDLGGNSLKGTILPGLGDLGSLMWLNLSRNRWTGTIPPELGNLAKLRELRLYSAELTGPIPPEFGNLVSLTWLRLDGNRLTAPIPSELGNLASLLGMFLGGNNLTGTIPPEFGNLASLESLGLGPNNLTGTIPPELGDLANLRSLRLGYNRLTGTIPRSLAQIALDQLSFEGNDGLCVPGTAESAAWIARIGQWEGPFCNKSDIAALEALFRSADGPGWADSGGWLDGPALSTWHGVRADTLGLVTAIDLSDNGLAGRLSPELGELAQLAELRIGGNAGLSGRLPYSLRRLGLEVLHYAGTGLCAPAEAAFRAWLAGITSHEGTVECAPLSDRDILEALYHATGGSEWTIGDGWLTARPLGEWHGVEVDTQGRVTELRLGSNGLRGSIPPELGKLSNLVGLSLYRNELTGSIPPELGNLTALQGLGLYRNQLTGAIPPELGSLGSLRWLYLTGNRLTGAIPRELGDLANLKQLRLYSNDLTGGIPPELGNLANLEELGLAGNRLTGTIPPGLGNLARLIELWLAGNELTGTIPPEIGNLADLEHLRLEANELTGAIPPELGKLSSLISLDLEVNELTGAIPPELGNLSSLNALDLAANNLTGSVPPELGALRRLRRLSLATNPGLSGPLPTSLANLRFLREIQTGGTGLCAPSDARFLEWLKELSTGRVARCADALAHAYLTQAVQSRAYPVPLVAGEKALLRVFLTAPGGANADIPPVRARFYVRNREVHVENIPGKPGPIPSEVQEGNLSRSANAEIPAYVVRPGLEMVIEPDSDGTLDPALGVAKRIPATGRLPVEVRTMPLFDLTVIPFLWSEAPDSSVLDITAGMAADPDGHELLVYVNTLLPVGDLVVTAHDPVVTSTNEGFALLAETEAIRAIEGGTGHYTGTIAGPFTGPFGVANTPGRSSFSIPSALVLAHELGHNLSLGHAPCGTPGDPLYPYPDGSIGAWGYDSRLERLWPPDDSYDLMSYCGPKWISDHYFEQAFRYRVADGAASGTATADPDRSLLLWGGIGSDGQPYLEPAFVVDARPMLPGSGGDYRIAGRTREGAELFDLAFAMPEVADGDGSTNFAFVLPVQAAWDDDLASITLSGPGGSATLDESTDQPMAILRDPRTGQVRGFLRDPPPATRAAADAVGGAARQGLETLFSRGIPDAGAWRR